MVSRIAAAIACVPAALERRIGGCSEGGTARMMLHALGRLRAVPGEDTAPADASVPPQARGRAGCGALSARWMTRDVAGA
ncbi:hypothetical protein WS67_22060 [Burkholderia singularis]|uniref:Uncharacterized protein n=1 Tax=Burkholderia singularis TaxID=1503053 RepID=A0A103DW98_9BURK|nr:hypothetical protein WS67_22060 [Burkholderia singularis]